MWNRRASFSGVVALVDGLRTGIWLSVERIRLVAFMLLGAYAITIGLMLATSHGILDSAGRPLGTDFANVYAAGRMVLEGRAAEAWDWRAHFLMQQAVAGQPDIPFYGWHYPPFFLALAASLALLPYLGALALWQIGSFVPLLAVIRGICSNLARHDAAKARVVLLLTLAFPAAFVNITHGHNGFLTAALLGGALLVLDSRPLLAGMLMGVLAYKPQFGVLIPLVLVVTGRWQSCAAAALTVLAMSLAALAAWGFGPWAAFFNSLTLTQSIVLEQGGTGFYKIQSVFAALRMWGASPALAYGAQALCVLAIAACLVRLWRSAAAFELKAASLIIGSLMATPYTLDYDLVALGPALAFLVAHGARKGFSPFEASLLALAWMMPILARSVAMMTGMPLAILVLTGLFLLVCQRSGAFSRIAKPIQRSSHAS